MIQSDNQKLLHSLLLHEIFGFRVQQTDFHFDEYLRSYSMPTIDMLKVVYHTVPMRKH